MESNSAEVPVLTIRCLGEFSATYGGEPVAGLATPRLQVLLVYLLVHRAAPQARRHLAFLFWPDVGEAQALNSFRVLLHALRSALPDVDRFIHVDAHTIQWQPSAPAMVDLVEFEAALECVARVDRALEAEADDGQARQDAYRAAVDCYEGDLLPGCYDDWILAERERLRLRYGAALGQLVTLLESQGAVTPAVLYAQRLIQHDPLYEPVYAALMRLYAALGDRVNILRTFEACAAVLERELGVAPGVETRQLRDLLLSDERVAVAPAPVAALIQPQRLPAPFSGFVGRSAEVAHVRQALATGRLVTLVGPGGSGKTRLALEAARELEATNAFPDGIGWVDLSELPARAITHAASVVLAVSTALGLVEQLGPQPIDALAATLRPRRLLLLLDNCEHVTLACAQVAKELLVACPELRILATSSESLGLPGEITLPLLPLCIPKLPDAQDSTVLGEWPPADATAYANQIAGCESVQLFVERARATWPTFTLHAGNAPAVAHICRQLDGMPLAIELAAVWVRVLTPMQIAERLDDSLSLLTRGDTTLPRHRTLRAMLDWSYKLLSPTEQRLLCRLSVFSGGFTLAAAEAVCAGTPIRAPEILDLLSALADKSLVTATNLETQAEARYSLLEMVRQYAAEKLAESGETGETVAVRQSHLAYFRDMAVQSEAALRSPQQVVWIQHLEAEHDNLRAALAWGSTHDAATALTLAGHLSRFWEIRNYLGEGRKWLERVIAMARGLAPVAAMAWALFSIGALTILQQELGEARQCLDESLCLSETLDDKRTQACANNFLGIVYWMEHDTEEARAHFQAGHACAVAAGDRWEIAQSWQFKGWMAKSRHEYAAAHTDLARSLAIFREVGDQHQACLVLRLLADLCIDEGSLAEAHSLLVETLQGFRQIGARLEISRAMDIAGKLAYHERHDDQAVRWMAAVAGYNQRLGVRHDHANAVELDEQLASLRTRMGTEHFNSMWAAAATVPFEAVVDEALQTLVLEPERALRA